ncbi:MAG: prepilin-type N-terminal cleavage/methylation domain-containing protein [Candidatus Colwellbacteria bacterium]|nr:prepilin-type N-terminal cleavage/methylation domain-containing protein [Candidatus Colwellbacteria bacterium]
MNQQIITDRQTNSSSQSGFTLMETMVALGVFSVIVTIVGSIFVSSLRSARFVSIQSAAIDNTALVVEQITREVRTGVSFTIPNGQSQTLSFVNYKGQNVSYSFADGRIAKNGSPLTAEGITVNGMFYITDFSGATTPRITIVAGVKDPRKDIPLINIQTTVGARLIYYKT